MAGDPTPRASRALDLGERLTEARAPLVAHVRVLLGPRSTLDPDDVVQEALTRAWSHRASFDEARPLLPWLKTVALRTVIDLRERRGPAALDEEPAAPAVEPAAVSRDEVRALLARLPARDARLLRRFHRDGASLRELAAEEGLPLGTLKSLLHRARRRLLENGR